MSAAVLTLEGVTASYGRGLLNKTDLEVGGDECIVAFGVSGSGKKVLLRVAAGVLEPSTGRAELTRPEKGLPVGYVPNEGGLLNNMTLLQNAALPVVYHGLASLKDALSRATDLFDMFGITKSADRRPSMVGAGARRLALLARAVLAAPKLYVMDEPLDDIDAATARTIQRVLARLKKDHTTAAIVSTGNLTPYLDWGTRFLFLNEGSMTEFKDRKALEACDDPAVRIFL